MFFERSDQDFCKAANSVAEGAALLTRLRRARRNTTFFLVGSVMIGLACGAWAAHLLLQSVEVAARSVGEETGIETRVNAGITTVQILKFAIYAIVFQLPFTFIHLFRLDTCIKLLLYLEKRERPPVGGLEAS